MLYQYQTLEAFRTELRNVGFVFQAEGTTAEVASKNVANKQESSLFQV